MKICEKAGEDIEKGAIIVTEVKTGDILAMTSFPEYSIENLGACIEDERSPLINRCFYSYSIGSVFKLVGFYHSPTLKGIVARMTEGLTVVVIVGCDAVESLARHKHRIVCRGVVIVIAVEIAASVNDLHSVHILIEGEIECGFKRPSGVVIGYEEARIASALHHIADALGGVNALVIGLVFVKFDLRGIDVLRVAPGVLVSVPADLCDIVGLKRDEAHMTAFAVFIPLAGRVYFHFIRVEGKKVLVCKLGVGNENVVIGVSDDGITHRHIVLFNFLGSPVAVGNGSVAMKIGFIKVAVFGEQILFHKRSPRSVFYDFITFCPPCQ